MNREIPREAYLAYARSLTEKEQSLIEEFSRWLPETIIDCHAHCNLPEHVRSIGERAYHHMLSTFPSFNLAESKTWHALLHPDTIIRTLRFPKTFRGIDHKAANRYLLEQSPQEDRVALYGLPDDPDYTIGTLNHPRVSALKMYYSYLEPPAAEIYQYFPKTILRAAEILDVPIILHPPRRITDCLDQILDLANDFPRLRICLAHLGLTKHMVPGLDKAFAAIAMNQHVSFDTALVPSEEVVSMALRIVGPDRIMYGSDEPLGLIRSVAYQHPKRGERLATEYPYHWVDPTEHAQFKSLAAGATHAHWQALTALKNAITAMPQAQQAAVKQKIFHNNAKSFYGF